MKSHSFVIAISFMFLVFLDCHANSVGCWYQQQEEKVEKQSGDDQREQPKLPNSVLRNLRVNFEKLEPTMCDEEVFATLGLAEYQKELTANSRFLADGAGGDWRYFIDDQQGYSLAFRSFWGTDVKCWLKFRSEKLGGGIGEFWINKSIDAKPIKPTQLELNPPRSNRLKRK